MAEVQFIYTTVHLLQLIGNVSNCCFATRQSIKTRCDVNLALPKLKTKIRGLLPRANYTELYRLSTKLVPSFVDRGRHVVSVTNPYGHILGFLDRFHYFFFQVPPQLYSLGRVDPIPDPLLLIKSGSTGNRTRTSESVARNSAN
jgi:hypothetical protein